ncbi:predicted protein [Uncinocarpus reesii 1704]|uniref:C6 finger domain transcription factor nscR n=1 Tax=Uncinocarpus reesii (strain UAMH 1704) TaxID=336963 RepID=C4JJK8_UNCRE|nr:uncharacterized protein UREG_01815 [Uncinocarpus reesii 1704]EEP76966.1 predicted protein [Uncinocarpus reesii 1704]
MRSSLTNSGLQAISTPVSSDPSQPSTISDAPKDRSPVATGGTAMSDPRSNPRSCVTCRRRKIRCNKVQPCSNCVKARVECVFPKPGRAPRKSKKGTEAELLARLKTLEAAVKSIGKPEAVEGNFADEAKPSSGLNANGCAERSSNNAELDSVNDEMGRLVVSDDQSRYISNRFWTRFGDEIEELKNMIDCPTSDEDDYPSPGDSASASSPWTGNDGFLFGFRSAAHSLREFHLPPEKFGIVWETYLENVAPIVPIFHRPSLKNMLWNAVANLDSVNKNTEALLFTVYYTVITSMTPEQCLSQLGEDRDAALNRYRFAVEQALAKANILSTHSLVLLQSLVLFLICVRQSSDSRYILSMTAIAIQIGRGIGLHRDGATFGLAPLETELRRRLWLQICLLDFCCSLDHGCDPMVHEHSYDTRPPLNINDDDISPDSKEPPEERVGYTDMTFLLFRSDIVVVSRRFTNVPPSASCKRFVASISQKEREEMVENLSRQLEHKYVQHCDMSIPIQWVCGALSRLVVAKLLLVIHHPMTREDVENSVPEETENRLFFSAIEMIEFGLLLETNANTSQWRWLFRTDTQWHALAYVLSNLCVRQPCPVVERAWNAVNAAYKGLELKGQQKGDMLWRGIRKLMARALQFREMQSQRSSAGFGGHEPYTNGFQPSNDTSLSQPLASITYLHQPQQAPVTAINLAPGPVTGFSPGVESYNPSPIDLSTLSPWPPLPLDSMYDTGVSNINASITSAPPSWDEWNRVVREFQLDIGNDGMVTSGQAPIWFE